MPETGASTGKIHKATREQNQAISSLREELEAIDLYRQRADTCTDESLKAVLLHNMKEEIEHAAMLIEWLRRNNEHFDKELRDYLFTDKDLAKLEAANT